MCGPSLDSTLTIGSGAAPAGETRQQRIARLLAFHKTYGVNDPVTPVAPDLTDAMLADQAGGAVRKARAGQGRRSTLLTAGSVGDLTSGTLLGGK